MKTAALAAAFVAVLGFSMQSCGSTGSPRCDRVLGDAHVLSAIADHGWSASCAAPFAAPAGEAGWADVGSSAGGAVPRTVYVWPDAPALSTDAALIMLAGHEDGHVVEAMYGHAPDEARASEWSWCNWPQVGVGMPGYGPPAGGCVGFIP